jgi:hypothetical protein
MTNLERGKESMQNESIWNELLLCDSKRDVSGVSQQAMRLLILGHVPSLSVLETQLRLRNAATHLFAHPYSPNDVPAGTVCWNPLLLCTENNNQPFYVIFSVEDAQSNAKQLESIGAATAQDNLQRLRNDYCGFLVRKCSMEQWSASLENFDGSIQADRAEQVGFIDLPACLHCLRFPTKNTQLRAIDCCRENLFICSKTCWQAHVEKVHGTPENEV